MVTTGPGDVDRAPRQACLFDSCDAIIIANQVAQIAHMVTQIGKMVEQLSSLEGILETTTELVYRTTSGW